jgi:hypothetical protein
MLSAPAGGAGCDVRSPRIYYTPASRSPFFNLRHAVNHLHVRGAARSVADRTGFVAVYIVGDVRLRIREIGAVVLHVLYGIPSIVAR